MTQDAANPIWGPLAIRDTRQKLKVSRKAVELATGLSSSVVWRAEQEDKEVKPEQVQKIMTVLAQWLDTGVPTEYAPKKPAGVKSDTTAELQKVLNQLKDHDEFIIELTNEVEQKITEAKTAKRGTKDLQFILNVIATYRTEHTI